MNHGLTEYLLYQALSQHHKLKISECSSTDIKGLRDKGLAVNEINEHYQIQQSLILLSSIDINKHLQYDIIKRISGMVIEYEVNSTNVSIHEYEYTQDYLVMLAEYQHTGKGRRVKQWYSPLGSNIYLSLKFSLSYSEYTHFVPLVTALSLCKALKCLGIEDCMIKWPNDIYVKGKKIAGILAENRYNSITGNTCVVGIGLNVNMSDSTAIDQSWTSLALEKRKVFDRNRVTALLLSEVINQYDQLTDFDANEFIEQWHQYDYLQGKTIMVYSDNSHYEAVVIGLSGDGSLQIKVNGYHKNIYSADVFVIK